MRLQQLSLGLSPRADSGFGIGGGGVFYYAGGENVDILLNNVVFDSNVAGKCNGLTIL